MEKFEPLIPSAADAVGWLAQHLISTFSSFPTPIIETEKVKYWLSQPPLELKVAMWLIRDKQTSAGLYACSPVLSA